MPDPIGMNSLVLMHYQLAFPDGTVIESSYDDEPVEIEMGKQELTEGMELAIYGLNVGDHQSITLTPEQGYGRRDEDNIHDMPASDFPEELKPEMGLTFSFDTPGGDEVPGTIRRVKDNMVEVDFNHPLAGHDLVFTVDILGVGQARSDEPTEDHYETD